MLGIRLADAERARLELAADLDGADSVSGWARRVLMAYATHVIATSEEIEADPERIAQGVEKGAEVHA